MRKVLRGNFFDHGHSLRILVGGVMLRYAMLMYLWLISARLDIPPGLDGWTGSLLSASFISRF